MVRRMMVVCLAAGLVAGCGGKKEAPKKGAAPAPKETAVAAAPQVGVDYSKPAILTDAGMKTLCACVNEMKAAKVDPMPKKQDDPAAMEALGSPEKLGAMMEELPEAKAILDKHGLDGATFAHEMLTAAACTSVAIKSKDWAEYQKNAKAMRAQMSGSTTMMKGFMQAGLQNLEGEEKAKKQKQVDQMIKAMEQMMALMADYAEQSPKGNYELCVKYKDELAAAAPEKKAGK